MSLGSIWAETNENNTNKQDVYELYVHTYLYTYLIIIYTHI